MPKMTPEQAGLLKAICDDPDEDTPRLVYADWLDEQAGSMPSYMQRSANLAARAEFIRIQVAEAAKGGYHPNGRSMTARERELLAKWNTPDWWQAELPEHPGLGFSTHHYERGFPLHLYAKSVRSFLKAALDVYSQVPATWIRFAVITAKTAGELARSPFLARVRYFDQLNGITDEALRGLANSPHLGGMTKLVF